jgi:hypothetical protein
MSCAIDGGRLTKLFHSKPSALPHTPCVRRHAGRRNTSFDVERRASRPSSSQRPGGRAGTPGAPPANTLLIGGRTRMHL